MSPFYTRRVNFKQTLLKKAVPLFPVRVSSFKFYGQLEYKNILNVYFLNFQVPKLFSFKAAEVHKD